MALRDEDGDLLPSSSVVIVKKVSFRSLVVFEYTNTGLCGGVSVAHILRTTDKTD